MFSSKKAIIGSVLATGVVAGAGLAWANWSGNATGTGNAKARTAATVTITAATGADDLYPGAQGDIDFTLSNNNPYPVTFTEWTATTIVTSPNAAGCPSSNVTVNDTGSISIPVAAGASNLAASIDDVVTMLYTAPDACQGQTFAITLALTGAQTAS